MASKHLGSAVIFADPEGATPISPEEQEELIPDHITTREQLNEWEQTNILQAQEWAFGRSHDDVLSVSFLRELHRRMFDRTWTWAGQFRSTETNIGVAPHRIRGELVDVCRDIEYWIENDEFPVPKAAARYHHDLVSVHPFPNGNGRHARLAADVLLDRLGYPRFDWGGQEELYGDSDRRTRYLEALRSADDRDYGQLYKFLGLDA